MQRYILDVEVFKVSWPDYDTYIRRILKEVTPTGHYYYVGDDKYIEVLYDGWFWPKKRFVPESTVREVKRGRVV